MNPISPRIELRELPGRLKGLASLCHGASAALTPSETASLNDSSLQHAGDFLNAIIQRAQDIQTDLLRLRAALPKGEEDRQ